MATTVPDFLLPDLGEGLTEAEVVSWHVQVGDTVVIDQIVVEVETAKAVVEVPVPFAGVVSSLHATEGQTVDVGAPLIGVTAAEQAAAGEGFREPGALTAQPSEAATGETSGNVLIGYGTPALTPRRRRGRRTHTALPVGKVVPPVATSAPPAAAASIPAEAAAVSAAASPAVISPLVRKLARDARVDIATITGSGRGGVVMRSDVEQEISRAAALAVPAQPTAFGPEPSQPAASQPATTRSISPQSVPAYVSNGHAADQRIPIRGLRKVVADKLSRSRREIPEATVWVDVDATELLATRAALNARDPQRPVSVLALLARFTVVGLRRHPELNGRVENDEIVLPTAINLGFAAQTDRGLVVPVVQNAHQLTTRELSAAIAAQTAAARVGGLHVSDLTGGTFTVNNYGVFGVDGSAAIINHPEVGILGIGRIISKPWVVDDALAIRKITQLTLSFDHRVCDGAAAGGFLRFIADCVERPTTALGEV